MPSQVAPSRGWPLIAGYGVLGFVSALGIGHGLVYAVAGSPPTLWQHIVPVVVPVVFGGVLFWGFSRAVGRLEGHRVVASLSGWVLAGWVFWTLTALLFAFMQEMGGGVFVEPALTANLTGLGGSVLALFLGASYAENRIQRERAEALRDHLMFFLRLLRHDIRNDATMIHGYADLLSKEADRDAVRYIRSGARHILDLTHLARTVSRSPTDRLFRVPLASVLEETVDACRERFGHATIHVEANVDPDVDVLADDLLPRVIENLVNNAVLHNPRQEPTVTVTAEPIEDTARVRIQDDGPGVPEDVQARLFEEGVKGRASEGTGLGLFLVKTLVEEYGGSVRLEATGPAGSTILVELPLARPEGAHDA